MSAGLKYESVEPASRSRSGKSRTRRSATSSVHNRVASFNQVAPTLTLLDQNERTVRRLPKPQPHPIWLQALIGSQKGVAILTLPILLGVLAMYAQTVYVQQLWNREYHTLEMLKRHERQLIAANEALKNQIAKQAEQPTSGMVSLTSANTIFLKPTPVDTKQPSTVSVSVQDSEPSIRPMGY